MFVPSNPGDPIKPLFVIFVLFFLGTLCFAVENTPSAGLNANLFEMQYEKIACRADFYTSVLKSIKSAGLNVNVDVIESSIATHKEELKVAADSGGRQAFSDAVKALQGDSKQLVSIYGGLKNIIPNGAAGKEIKTKLKTDFSKNKETRNNCLKDASIGLGKVQLDYVKTWKTDAENTIATLSAKGLDTTKMDDVLSDLQGKIDRMEDVLATSDVSQIENARKEIREEHLHIWARFQIVRIDAILNILEPKATEKGLSTQVQEIRSLLSDADSKVVVGKFYNEGEFQQVQETLKQAVAKLRTLFKSVN